MANHLSPVRRWILLPALSLLLATAIWMPCIQLCFQPPPALDDARAMIRHYEHLWSAEVARAEVTDLARSRNPEWDFMGRTFLVLALADLALRDDQPTRPLSLIDAILDDTLAAEAAHGHHYFLLRYSRGRPFVQQPMRSLFVDGEIALMCAARRMLADDPRCAREHRSRVAEMARRMRAAPLRCCESYPDECWMFCNAAALAAIRLADVLDGSDHGALLDDWLAHARRALVHPTTGLLVSKFTLDGKHLDGPEGSSIWFTAHCLRLVDADFARDQYQRARRELGSALLGFGWAGEWPESWVGPEDVDSGPTIPLLRANAGASGLALLGAASFGDTDFHTALRRSVELAAFPERGERLRFGASNVVGDAVLLYSLVAGPIWQRAERGR